MSYRDPVALARLRELLCPECGGRTDEHDGAGGPHGCSLTDNGVAQRIHHQQQADAALPDPVPSWGGGTPTAVQVLVCTRCSFLKPVRLPVGGGSGLQEQALATVYVDEDTRALVVVPHHPGCHRAAR